MLAYLCRYEWALAPGIEEAEATEALEGRHHTATLMSQVRLVTGPAALARHARAYFVAGNHDWGLKEEFEGIYARWRADVEVSEACRHELAAHSA